jgi:hypothetical protein
MTLSFVAAGASPSDITSVIDNVGVQTPAIPEPGTFFLLGGGLLALGSMFKLKQRN